MSWAHPADAVAGLADRLAAVAEMSRPRQVAIMATLYLLGATAGHVAGRPVPVRPVALGGGVVVLGGASSNLLNEYVDVESDRRSVPTPFSGGSGALLVRDLSRQYALVAAVATLGATAGLTALGVVFGVLPPAAGVVVAAFLLLGWGYSAPPLELAWRGMGELGTAVAGGLVLPVLGQTVVTGALHVEGVAAFLPTTAFLFLTLLATTWPDRQNDARVGKATLATRLSPGRLRLLYAVWLVAAAVLVGGLPRTVLPAPVVAATAASLPAFVLAFRRYARQHSPTPTVLAMVLATSLQVAAWLTV